MFKTLVPTLALALLISACGNTPPKDTNADKYAADDAMLAKTHAELQQRLDTATVHFEAFAKRLKDTKPDDPSPRELERATIWLGDLQAMVDADEQFITQRAAAIKGEGDPEELKALAEHYDQLMQGHASMVTEFNQIADKLEKRMSGY